MHTRKFLFIPVICFWLLQVQAQSLEVQFSDVPGFYQQPLELRLTVQDAQATIYFTTDGTVPSTNSLVYSSPLQLSFRDDVPNDISLIPTNNIGPGHPYREDWRPPAGIVFKIHTIRAKAFLTNGNSGPTTTASYLIDTSAQKYSMPIFSLVTDRDSLFGFERGIYVPGITGGNYFNRGIEWERPVHVEMFETNGQRVIAQDAGVRIHGGTSRNRPRKTLRFYARAAYGPSWFDYTIYPDKPVSKYKRFLLRNSGNDWSESVFRDAFIQALVKENTTLDIQYSRPAIVFINGEYWGIHNIRDRFDDRYLEAHYGLDPERITILEGQGNLDDGNPEGQSDYANLYQFITQQDMTLESNYQQAALRMDMNNYIDYNLIHIFSRNTDWPGNNVSYWRYLDGTPQPGQFHPDDGRWRWFVFDTDFGFGLNFDYVLNSANAYGGNNGVHHTLNFALEDDGPGWPNPPWSTAMLRSLMQNESFKNQFITRYADHLNTTYSRDRTLQLLDSFQNVYTPEISEHIFRWNEPSMSYWHDEIQVIRSFASIRTNVQRAQMNNKFDLGGTATIHLDINDHKRGTVQINTLLLSEQLAGVEAPVFPWNGIYYRNLPVVLIPHAEVGYAFSHWSGDISSTDDTLHVWLDPVSNITAHFIESTLFEGDSMNPVAFRLSEADYAFLHWNASEPQGSFPANMIFQQSNVNDPALSTEMTHPYFIPYNSPEDNEYHANDQDKIGFPYSLTGRTRIEGLSEDGIALINTGRNRDLGAVVLAVDTREVENLTISWKAETLEANSRTYNLRLQYRTGLLAPWKDVLDENLQSVEYQRTTVIGETQFNEIAFPEDAYDNSYVQLRWKYYYTGIRLSQESGARDKLRLDDIIVKKEIDVAAVETQWSPTLIWESIYPQPAGKVLNLNVRSTKTSEMQISIFNTIGLPVLNHRLTIQQLSSESIRLDTSRLPSGVYVCRITVDGHSLSKKVVISK